MILSRYIPVPDLYKDLKTEKVDWPTVDFATEVAADIAKRRKKKKQKKGY